MQVASTFCLHSLIWAILDKDSPKCPRLSWGQASMNKYLAISISSGVLIAGWVGYATFYRQSVIAIPREPVVHLPFDSKVIDMQIASEERAARIDPHGALGMSSLASAYMARSRESDDLSTAVKAEEAARKSLAIRILGNVGARNKLVQSLLQQHRFKDALAECEKAEAINVYSDDTTVLHADCLIEVGRYDDAGVLVSKNPRAFKEGPPRTVIARLLDIGGKPEEALTIYREVTSDLDQMNGVSGDTIAWFHTRLGMQLAKMGRHDEAREEYTQALKLYPRDYKSMAGLAKLASQDQKWEDAIYWGKSSDMIAPMADVRALVADAYAKLGDSAAAEREYERVATLVGRPSGMNDGLHEVTPAIGTHGHRLDRQYAIFCADHDRDMVGAYAAAIRDFENRRDIYSYDTLAWVCFKMGNLDEGKQSIALALSRGTKDPMLWFHAGEIYAAAGDDEKAKSFLNGAMAIDPHFDGIAATQAALTLTALASKGAKK